MKKLFVLLLILAVCAGVGMANLGERRLYPHRTPLYRFVTSRDPNAWWDDVNDVYTINGLLDVLDVNIIGDLDANNVTVGGDLTLTGFTPGSVLFVGTDANIVEDNANFLYDISLKKLTVENIDVNGVSVFGNTSGNNKTTIEADGDIEFTGDAGLAMAEIYVEDNPTATSISGSGEANKVQFTLFDVNGVSNNATPDHATDDITIITPAVYQVDVALTAESVAGAASEFSFDVYKNNGTNALSNVHAHRAFAGGGGDVGSINMQGKAALSKDDTIEIWVHNESNTQNIIVSDCTLGVIQIAGISTLPGVDFILLESGDFMLQEDGTSKLFIEPTT